MNLSILSINNFVKNNHYENDAAFFRLLLCNDER